MEVPLEPRVTDPKKLKEFAEANKKILKHYKKKAKAFELKQNMAERDMFKLTSEIAANEGLKNDFFLMHLKYKIKDKLNGKQ